MKVKNILKSQRGQGLVEYGLLVALIAIISISALVLLGPDIAAKFNEIRDELANAKPAKIGE